MNLYIMNLINNKGYLMNFTLLLAPFCKVKIGFHSGHFVTWRLNLVCTEQYLVVRNGNYSLVLGIYAESLTGQANVIPSSLGG